jgi:hypothetical protein
MEADKSTTGVGEAASEGSTRCDGCKSCGAILELDGCGHRFHPRCIFSWPLTQCEQCAAPVTRVKVFREFRNSPNSMVRKGKWSVDEHKYANMMMKQFQAGALPLVDGLHLRGFIASLLQCDPLRVTKKYAGQSIGKQNFFYQQHKGYCYNLHIKLQKRVSSLRNHFYWHIQYRCKFGFALRIQELKAAEVDYWVREFLRFADKIGQKVEMAASPSALPASPLSAPSTPLPQGAEQSAAAMERSLSPSPEKTKAGASFFSSISDAEPMAVSLYSLRDVKKFSLTDVTAPSSKELSSAEYAVSPLSFDEWTDPAMVDMTSIAFDLSPPDMPMTLAIDAVCKEEATQDKKPVTSKTRLSLGHWIEEADLQWREAAVSVPSWSFSQLSDTM